MLISAGPNNIKYIVQELLKLRGPAIFLINNARTSRKLVDLIIRPPFPSPLGCPPHLPTPGPAGVCRPHGHALPQPQARPLYKAGRGLITGKVAPSAPAPFNNGRPTLRYIHIHCGQQTLFIYVIIISLLF